MKIAIIGAGAMGCLYGGKLSQSKGNQVFLLDIWKEHIDAINKQGLIIEENGEPILYSNLKASLHGSDIGPADLVIVFVKSTLTRQAVQGAKELFGRDTLVLTLQNGLGNVDLIGEEIGLSSVIGGTTAHGAYMKGPGEICHAGFGKTIIGELSGTKTARIEEIATVFRRAGLETEVSQNILGLIWDKLIVNVGINALTGITSLHNGELLDHPELLDIMRAAIEEAVAVANSKNIELSPQDPYMHTLEICKSTAANKSSMLQDIMNDRRTEIDMINGGILREGEKEGILTPVNRVLTDLIKYWEQKQSIDI